MWKIDVYQAHDGTYRWKLVNRRGDVVMVSHEGYASRVAARVAADHELKVIREQLHLAA